MLKLIVVDSESRQHSVEASRLIAAYGFYFSVAAFCYGALFPFTFNLSNSHLAASWNSASLTPFWDTPGRHLHGIPDMVANLLVTLPLGFFGFLHHAGKKNAWALWKWGILGMVLGLSAEIIELAIPSRSSGITDILNNGIGALAGAAMARAFGGRALAFLTGSTAERRNIYLWMLILSMVVIVGPFDFDPDYLSRFETSVAALSSGWMHSFSLGEEWLRIAGFAMIGAFAGRLAVPGKRKPSCRARLSALALVSVFPLMLGCARLLVESHPPYAADLVVEFVASVAGFGASLIAVGIVRAEVGFLVWNLAIIAAGLSPFQFVKSPGGQFFQWVPFYEYCTWRAPFTLYGVVLTLFSFAVAGGLLQLSFTRSRRIYVVAYAMALASVIEYAQVFLPAHSANITDILMAGLGAWTGSVICSAVASSRQNGRVVHDAA